MNTQTPSIIRQPGEGEIINAYGDTLELKLGTPDTGGLLYSTTELFLDRLGLSDLGELPSLGPLLPDVDAVDDV